MKRIHLLALCFVLLALISCHKEAPQNCRPNTYGTYSSSNLIGGIFQAEIQKGSGEKGVIVVLSNKDASGTVTNSATATGELNENCTTLTIPKQQVGTQTYSGTFAVTETQLSGNVKIDQLILPLVLTKQ